MTRVRYLAGLVGAAERRPAPLLRPPRRLFPHEPLPVEPLPVEAQRGVSQAPVAAGDDPPTPELPVIERVAPAARAAQEPVRREPKIVPLTQARGLATATAPAEPAPVASRAGPRVEPPQLEAVHVAEALPSPKVRVATRATDAPPPPRGEVQLTEPKPTSRDPEPAPTVLARRSMTTLEPSRLRPPLAPPPEPAPAAARASGLHIGTIEVTVAPPPATPREPGFEAPPAPVHRPPAPFAPRGASMTRWFGLAQR